MPFRLNGYDRAKIQFTTSSWMPSAIYRACLVTGIVSNTVYVQRAVCEALARDLGLDLVQLLNDLPEPRANSAHLYERPLITEENSGGVRMVGPANTVEEVR
jgi:hypothetical protein